ncbi:type II toxin-antitoxin system Phd/YefM family antitoxin [Candidatus Protochlamydia sp. R18]|uniref:type II toxin-antitoxin system Phd/YefM family antitoxin n=1 Tax=Candidatus Protochlamydia sp. R18 TaxID=1353977 RepID=UPI0005A6B86F|nr:type II toxin-antitoxin system Phd/YefM family antitoxin [Candidatus Protochlamydia sp. R18]
MEKVKVMSFVEFRQNLSECVNLAKYKGERFLITRNGKTVGAFVPVEDLEKINAFNNVTTDTAIDEISSEFGS